MRKFIFVVIALLFSFLSVNMAYAATFSQADLTGTWRVNILRTGVNNLWIRTNLAINSSGVASCLSTTTSTGVTSCPVPFDLTYTMNETTGVITPSGNDAPSEGGHITMSLNKNFMAGTATSNSGTYQIFIAQKEVPDTTYSNADVQNKSLVQHELRVGSSNEWDHWTGTTNATGQITITSETDSSSGTKTPGATSCTISVNANGVVTITGCGMDTYEGFLSADKKTIVVVGTHEDTSFDLSIVQITGQTYPAGSVPDHRANVHMLAAGTTSPAPFWAHWVIKITGGTGTTSDWVASDAAVTAGGSFSPQLSASGTVTITEVPSYHGQVSHDGTFTVATRTIYSGITPFGYALLVNTKVRPPKNDFNNDGISDVLLRNTTTGEIRLWFMNDDGTVSSSKTLMTNTAWTIVGTGFFNVDGISDILLRNSSTGQLNLWYMKSDGTASSSKTLMTNAAFTVVGTGDVNSDGISDILLRNASTGQLTLWFMKSDGTHTSKVLLTNTAWTVEDTGDVNGDGRSDILLNNTSTGQHVLWFMNANGTHTSKTLMTNTAWTIVGTGYSNADGISDILWRKASTGSVVLWFMNADGTKASDKTLLTNTAWTVVP